MHQRKPSLIEIPEDMPGSRNLRDQIYGQIKRRILSGRIAPGEHLREKALCEELEVSRTPLREALNRLGNEDLVIFRPHCGYLAAPISAEEARRLQELRRIVESKVAALAAVKASEEDIKLFRAAAEMPEIKAGDDASFVAFCQANARFHLLLAQCVDNHFLEQIVMSSLDQYQRPAYLGIGRVTDHKKPSKCHHDIVDAIEARDPTKAEVVMCGHVIGGSERIIAALIEAGY
ncbi:GntR family transcriptional regulator [Puniceicoccales bacterium CK1056]|uniref:GntR family transcriptional regulator n=1 Tax=Oceanipulchritudo coccoides TaxID=2706888 RepID=A0A6B2M1H7_9BACT|nr:GntR family transcriptional regulator [Oceanipulchritudo coccoides]NDV62202.1 GntR family transcriptional regulator [Oceanipulchritudo coccoides]